MDFDLSKLPDNIKLQIRKGDLEAFAQMLLEKSQQFISPVNSEKEILTIDGAAEFTGLSKQTFYEFSSRRTIPVYKRGKNILFRRSELETWMLANKRKTVSELTQEITFKPKTKKS